MILVFQDKYKEKVQHLLDQNNLVDLAGAVSFIPDRQQLDRIYKKIQFIIGDSDFISQFPRDYKKINIADSSTVPLQFLFKNNTIAQFGSHQFDECLRYCHQYLNEARQIEDFKVARKSYEEKRAHLEKLNQFLGAESDEKLLSIQKFIDDESLKKEKEKKLLYFLDFLNSEYDKKDFLFLLCQFLWNETKKVGQFNQLGLIIEIQKNEWVIVTSNLKEDKIQYGFKFSENEDLSSQLANFFQRPFAKVLHWASTQSGAKHIVYLESKSPQNNHQKIDDYFNERHHLITLLVHRWFLFLHSTYLINKWNRFAQSYNGPMHVIDGNFNLIQANYVDPDNTELTGRKCYQVLASRQTICEGCPVIESSQTPNPNLSVGSSSNTPFKNNFIFLNGRRHKSFVTSFSLKEKYSFVCYDDQTESDQLKSKMIHDEKMNVLGQLANHLAHELNNPLTGLKLMTEMLIQENSVHSHSGLSNDLNEILKGIDRSKMIIQDLMSFTHTNISSSMSVVNLSDVVKKTLAFLKSVTRHHQVFVDVKDVTLSMHPGHFQLVLFNLVKNACQAMTDKGTLKIYDYSGQDYYDLIIDDTGPGLPLSVRDNLFQPFTTTKPEGEGTGLGLSLSKNLLERMHAQLIYDDQYKNGTRFIMRFRK